MKKRTKLRGLAIALTICYFGAAQAQVSFTDVAVKKGLTYKGKSFGSSWGDLNQNGYPDLYMSCHMNFSDPFYDNDFPHIFLNLDGVFFQKHILDGFDIGDWHGAGLFDFDNDGDLDIYNMVGGSGGNIFLVNNGTFNLINQAQMYNVDYYGGRGRTPSFLDIDNDGYIDILLNNADNSDGSMPTAILRNNEGTDFTDVSIETELAQTTSVFSSVANFGAPDGGIDILTRRERIEILNIHNGKFEFKGSLPPGAVADAATGDFNGNLKTDIILARGRKLSELIANGNTGFLGIMELTSNDPEVSISFQAGDSLSLWFALRQPISFEVHIGAESGWMSDINETIVLYAQADSLAGVSNEANYSTETGHLSIDFNDGTWTIKVRTKLNFTWAVSLDVTSNEPITNFTSVGFKTPQERNLQDALFFNLGNYEFEQAIQPAFLEAINSAAVLVSDFDNDMDLDIYFHSGGFAQNAENYLLVNDGEGNFTRVDGAWGATGFNGGVGESATVVDYNNDGFMDIFLANGKGIFFLQDGGLNLYENSGNSNHWVKLVLKGVQSNPAGIGTRVYAYAGGKAQVRTQTAGIHWVSQNDTRPHFGLAENTVVDSLILHWPSGIVQKLYDVEADQILTIVEDETVDVHAPALSGKFEVYPVPSNGLIHVVCDDPIKLIEVYNPLGQAILSHEPKGSLMQYDFELPTGSYLVRITDIEGGVGVQKVIVK